MTTQTSSRRPRLTFFVELDAERLAALVATPEVVPFLVELGCAVSMGLVDLTPERAAVVRRLESSGVPVTAWLLLDVQDGYWLNADNADNADRATERWRETAAWAASEGLGLQRVGLDIELPRTESEGAIANRRHAFFSMLRRRRSAEQIRAAEEAYAELVAEIRTSGRSVEAYHFPFLLDERAAGTTLLRRSLGLVDVPVDAEVYMLYSSYLGAAGARAYFPDASAIALGVTGGGVNANNPDAVRRFLSWERLVQDLRVAAAHSREVYVFSLEGCVEHGMLKAIADLAWDQPPPPLPPADERRAGIAQWIFRAEPLFDLLLPAQPVAD